MHSMLLLTLLAFAGDGEPNTRPSPDAVDTVPKAVSTDQGDDTLRATEQRFMALQQAIENLRRAGQDDLARDLERQSRKLERQIREQREHQERMAREARKAMERNLPGGIAGPPIPPNAGPQDVLRALMELRGEVQQMRRDVAELRRIVEHGPGRHEKSEFEIELKMPDGTPLDPSALLPGGGPPNPGDTSSPPPVGKPPLIVQLKTRNGVISLPVPPGLLEKLRDRIHIELPQESNVEPPGPDAHPKSSLGAPDAPPASSSLGKPSTSKPPANPAPPAGAPGAAPDQPKPPVPAAPPEKKSDSDSNKSSSLDAPLNSLDVQAELEHNLQNKVSIQLAGATFYEIIRTISRKTNANVVVDRSAVQAVIDPNTRSFSLDVVNVAASEALNRYLYPLQLAYVIDGEVLRITSAVKAVQELKRREALRLNELSVDSANITSTPTQAPIYDPFQTKLRANPSEAVLITRPAQIVGSNSRGSFNALRLAPPREVNIEEHLKTTFVTMHMTNSSLYKILMRIGAQSNVRIEMDNKALQGLGHPTELDERTFSIDVEKVPAADALRQLLGQVKLSYLVKDGAVVVTTADTAVRTLLRK